jgi:hypothetical protein
MSTTAQDDILNEHFDSDSYPIMIDKFCSKCMTNCRSDFVGIPQPVQARISGVGSPAPVLFKGIVKWRIEDDLGRTHNFLIPGTYYAPSVPFRMFSPQHWSQESCNKGGVEMGTWCATYEDKAIIDITVHHNTPPNTPISFVSVEYEGLDGLFFYHKKW